MKRVMTAALALSLLGGTSALAAPNDREERRAERQERREDKAEKRQERREEKAEEKQERRAVPQVAPSVREARERVQRRAEQVRERREDVRERREDLRERRQDLREQRQTGEDVREQRLRLQQRQDRIQQQAQEVRRQRERVQEQRERVQQRAENQRYEWLRNHRPGGYRLRDRDRSWYDASRWRRTYQASHRYRVPRYVYPSGWYVRVWNFGDILPHRSWYGQSYYLDWWRYGLPRPPIGTEWIRMRDDAILVDIWSGRVLAVYYDLFW